LSGPRQGKVRLARRTAVEAGLVAGGPCQSARRPWIPERCARGTARRAPSAWYPPGRPAPASTWRAWLAAGLVDDPGHRVHGWRPVLGADSGLNRLFRACELRVTALLDACPERRDLVHGDLLNRNVLIAEDLSRITAVFSWKCSVRADVLFDVAWCTFWGAWHPGVAAVDVWARTLHAPSLADWG